MTIACKWSYEDLGKLIADEKDYGLPEVVTVSFRLLRDLFEIEMVWKRTQTQGQGGGRHEDDQKQFVGISHIKETYVSCEW